MSNSTQTNTTTSPIRHRLGRVQGKIWTNAGEKGPYVTADFFRVYLDETTGEFKDVRSFSTDDVLKLAKLADQVHSEMVAMEDTFRAEADEATDAQ